MFGIFAGRGDIVIAMGMTALMFFYFGWKARGFKESITDFFDKRKLSKSNTQT